MKEERREGGGRGRGGVGRGGREGERRSGEMSGYVGWNSLAIG